MNFSFKNENIRQKIFSYLAPVISVLNCGRHVKKRFKAFLLARKCKF